MQGALGHSLSFAAQDRNGKCTGTLRRMGKSARNKTTKYGWSVVVSGLSLEGEKDMPAGQ